MATSLDQEFKTLADQISNLQSVPCFGLRMALWTLYKQAMYGDYEAEQLGEIDYPRYHKADVTLKENGWVTLKGMPKEEARNEYIELATTLLKKQ